VKSTLGLSYTLPGSKEHEGYKRNRNAPERFDTDGGRKTKCGKDNTDIHYRVYAPGSKDTSQERLFDPRWGYYVVASTHYDHGEATCPDKTKWFGYSERAEFRLLDAANQYNLSYRQDVIQTHNKEGLHRDTKDKEHIWENDGKASAIRIP
jgi:hypothetical protein